MGYIQIIAVLHDVRPHFLRVPAPGAEEMSHFCSVMDAGTCRYIPVIEIWRMHRITTTSQNTDQDVISSSSRWSVSEMMPRTLHPFYFLLMATFNQVRIHPAKLSTHSTCSGPISASWRDWPWNLYLSSKVQSPRQVRMCTGPRQDAG